MGVDDRVLGTDHQHERVAAVPARTIGAHAGRASSSDNSGVGRLAAQRVCGRRNRHPRDTHRSALGSDDRGNGHSHSRATGVVRVRGRARVRHVGRTARLRRSGRPTDRPGRRSKTQHGDRPDRLRSSSIPAGPGGSGVDYLRERWREQPPRLVRPGHLGPAWSGRQRTPRLCDRHRPSSPSIRPPRTRTRRPRSRTRARDIADTCQAADAALLPTLDHRRPRRATSNSCVLRSAASRSTTSDSPTALTSVSTTPRCSPNRYAAMVLDGVVDPGESLTEFLTGQAAGDRAGYLGDDLEPVPGADARLETAPIIDGDGQTVGPGVLGVAARRVHLRTRDGQKRFAARRPRRTRRRRHSARLRWPTTTLVGPSFAGYLGVLCADSPHPAAGERGGNSSVRSPRPRPTSAPVSATSSCPAPIGPSARPIRPARRSGRPTCHRSCSSRRRETPPHLSRTPNAFTSVYRTPSCCVRDGSGHTSYQVSTCVADAVRTYLRGSAVRRTAAPPARRRIRAAMEFNLAQGERGDRGRLPRS